MNPASQSRCDVARFRKVLEQQLQSIEADILAKTLALYRGEFLGGYTSSSISATLNSGFCVSGNGCRNWY